MARIFSLPTVVGNCGNIEGAATDGVLVGAMTAANPSKVLLKSLAQPCLCITDDGGLYVNETTPANEATADDVEIVGTTLAADDAIYIGHATLTAARIDISISTQGDYTDPVWAWEYWNGSAWTAVSGLSDGTTAWEAAAGVVSVTFTLPGDWAKNTVDSVLGYWIRASCTSVTASVTPCQIGQIWWVVDEANATWTDDTTDATDAGASDVATIPAREVVGDGLYIGSAEEFCKVKYTIGTQGVATYTITWKYWNGSAWTAIPASTLDDDGAGWTTGTSTYYTHFVPPTDWTANTAGNGPNGQTGFFVVAELTAVTSVTTVGLVTQMWVLPLVTGASGIPMVDGEDVTSVNMHAGTASATNADSVFLLVNVTSGAHASFTWTKGDVSDDDATVLAITGSDEIALVQITEDGTTEFADATFTLSTA